ncbi:MAG: hypothetical protein FWC76_06440 [Defluviitaleaceae bacterium]|nr:hypothetical protein [Defluviitaleaceae bacterium]
MRKPPRTSRAAETYVGGLIGRFEAAASIEGYVNGVAFLRRQIQPILAAAVGGQGGHKPSSKSPT